MTQVNTSLKVIFFANTDWYLFNFRLGLAKYLREKGMDVIMMSPSGEYSKKLESEGFKWYGLDMDRRSLGPIRELRLLKDIVKIYRKERPQIVHNFTLKCVVYGSLAAKVCGIKRKINAVTGLGHLFTVSTTRTTMLRPIVKRLLKFSLSGPLSRLILQNPDDQRAFLKLNAVEPSRIRIIRGSGVDIEKFNPRFRKPSTDRPRVLLAARLLADKGVREYVSAARHLKEQGVSADFLLAGAPDPGNPSTITESEIDDWKRQRVVTILDHSDNMDTLLQTIDIVVLPSNREGLPRGLLEGAAMGLPLIATDVPGCREVIRHGVNGYSIPVRDAEALATSIKLLIDNKALREKYGTAARKMVENEFCDQFVFTKTWETYQELFKEYQDLNNTYISQTK